MKRSARLIWLLVFLMAALAGCESGTSGSIVGGRETCSHKTSSGSCEGVFRKLNGTFGKDIENDSIGSGDAVQVRVAVSVEQGRVKVFVESPGGEITSVEATPGSAVTLEGVAEGSFDGFEVEFEAVEGEASGVSYKIEYRIP